MSKIALGIASFVHFILELAASLKGIGIHLVRVAIFIIFISACKGTKKSVSLKRLTLFNSI